MTIDDFLTKYPHLAQCRESIFHAEQSLIRCFREGKKLLTAGNGGSFADSLHICGELDKSFELDRPLSQEEKEGFAELPHGRHLAAELEKGLPAIALGANGSLVTALLNDKEDANIIFAQELYSIGAEGDVFFGITTSGNSRNIILAMVTAKVKKIRTILLAGRDGGEAASFGDAVIIAPGSETAEVQENHVKIYHFLCARVEETFFGRLS